MYLIFTTLAVDIYVEKLKNKIDKYTCNKCSLNSIVSN